MGLLSSIASIGGGILGGPLGAIAPGIIGSLFSPKQEHRTSGISDQIGVGDKYQELFKMLMQQAQGGGGALSQDQIAGVGQNMQEQSKPLLDSLLSQTEGNQARRGIADSRLGAFNTAQAGRDFSLQQSGKLSDLISQNAQQGFQGRQNAQRGLQGLVGQGINTAGAADNNEAQRGAQFGSALSGLTGNLAQFFQDKKAKEADRRANRVVS
jgi:hypothetical protein